MITFTPTDEQRMLIDTVHKFAESDIRKVAHDADEATETPPDIITKGWNLGLLPGLIPSEYGGYADGPSAITGVLALEELAWGDLGIALNIWTPAAFALPILLCGTEEQKKAHLPTFCTEDRPAATVALIEPDVKFDPWKPETTASLVDGKYGITGEKTYVPLADHAQTFLIFARNSESGQVDGYIVDRNSPGLEICERNALMGIGALPTYRIQLSGLKAALKDRIGGEAGTNYSTILSRSRIALGAMAVGLARAAFEYARDYAKERVQFGVPIATKQAIAFRLADVATEIDAARLLAWEAAWNADNDKPLMQPAAILKHYVSKMVMFATDSAVQVLGGHGYIREHPVERWLRNARGFAAFEALALV